VRNARHVRSRSERGGDRTRVKICCDFMNGVRVDCLDTRLVDRGNR
jgi:hypothetical protein